MEAAVSRRAVNPGNNRIRPAKPKDSGISMNVTMRISIGLIFLAGSIISAAAQAPAPNWAGEWGQFARIPATGHIAVHYEGAGLSVTDCANQQCHVSFKVLGRTFHAEAEGDLLVESDTEAVATLGSGAQAQCILAMHKAGTTPPSIVVEQRTGDCSYFATPGASFEHTYALRSRKPFYADDIPACFAGEGRAMVALCASRALSAQEHAWAPLVWEVSDLAAPRLDQSAELATILKACDAAPDPEGCLAKAFARSTEELNARKAAWKASVTEPGDPGKAKRAIAAIAGTYRHSFANGDVQGDQFRSTDTLEIQRISDTSIHVSVHLEFYNGHECNHQGVASYRRAGIFAEQLQNDQGKLCVFEVVPTSAGVQLQDPTGMCRMSDCGARGGYNGAAFLSKERVKVPSPDRKSTGRS